MFSNSKFSRFIGWCGVVFNLVVCAWLPLEAATIAWSGAGNDGRWANAANWYGNTLPTNGDDLYFHLTADATMINDLPANRTFVTVTFDRLGGGSNWTVLVSGNGFTAANVTIGPPMVVHLSCPFGGNSATLAMTIYGHLTLDAPLSGQDVVINQFGETTLGAAPTVSGSITANQGTLSLTGGITATVPLIMNGGLASVSGDNHWNGPITLSGGPFVRVDDVPAGSGRLTLGGLLTGTGGLGKTGAGVLVLAGTNSVTGPGSVQIDGGLVSLAAANALPTGCSLVLAGGDIALNGFDTAIASLSGGDITDHSGRVALGGATLTLAGNQPTTGFWNGTVTGPGSVHMTGNGWWEQNGIVQVPTRIDAGELDGIGTFTEPVIIGAATVAPGSEEWSIDPGTLTFAGGLTLSDTSTVIMDVGATAWDQIIVQGPAVLAGTLIIHPLPVAAPIVRPGIAGIVTPGTLTTQATLFSFSQPPTGRITIGAQPAGYGCVLERDPVTGTLVAAIAPAPSGNVPPVASDGSATVFTGSSTTAWLWASDANGDPVTYGVLDQSTNVHVDAFDAQAGTVRFTAWSSPGSQAWIRYVALDGQATSNVATIRVAVMDEPQNNGTNVFARCGGGIALAALFVGLLGWLRTRLL